MLPDDVLLEIFHFHVDEAWNEGHKSWSEDGDKRVMKAWQSLVHVCRRWRSIVFGSPRCLDLQLVCSAKTPARDTVEVWPALPLLIREFDEDGVGVDNIVALLERSDLVRQIDLWFDSSSQLEDLSEAMQVPFPELTHLDLRHFDEMEPVVPLSDLFFGGSAPRLRSLILDRIPYPGLPKLLLSATYLTFLHLTHIPHSGYISPEAMIACLSTLTSLERLSLQFESPPPRPYWESRHLPPLTRTVLPVLDHFWFKGVCEYLEYLVARIDAPRLRFLGITFFNDIVFVIPQLTRFISNTPILEAFDEARIALDDSTASVKLSSASKLDAGLNVSSSCTELDWQLSFLEQVCTSSLHPLSTLQDLYMSGRPWPQDWKDIIDYEQWQGLLHSFTTVKNLYLSKELAPCVVPALQELVAGRTTELFPNLQNILVEELEESGPVQEGIRKFVSARRVSSHPIMVSHWEEGSN